jgi:hypothetical protein
VLLAGAIAWLTVARPWNQVEDEHARLDTADAVAGDPEADTVSAG